MKAILSFALVPIAVLFLGAAKTEAATFSNLYNFTATSYPAGTNSDGANPSAGLILSGNTLYGTVRNGGISNRGTLFKLKTDGTGFTNLFNFNDIVGGLPNATLAISNNTLYGTTAGGGANGYGTVFKINADGTGYSNFLNFTYSMAGNGVLGGVVLSSNTVYGATDGGGTGFAGTIYKVNVDGTGYSNLHSFASYSGYPSATNTDGAFPDATLILSGITLYGTTTSGGSNANGTVFRINIDGTGFTNLYVFGAANSTFPRTNIDGRSPLAGLVSSGNTLYGTAQRGGSAGNGTVFKVNTDGTGFAVLHSFSTSTLNPAIHATTNSDGAVPYGGLVLSGTGSTLYGTTAVGGSGGSGTVFQLSTDGTVFTVLYSFTPISSGSFSTNNDGADPYATPIISGHTLYGTTETAGTGGSGTVFALTLASTPAPIPLSVQLAGGKAVLSWSDPTSVFSLQSAPAVTGVYTNLPGAVSPYTNPATASQSFFRLKSN